jgi:hypothetical protein
MTHLKLLGTEFVHDRLVQGNSPQNDENLVKQPLKYEVQLSNAGCTNSFRTLCRQNAEVFIIKAGGTCKFTVVLER